MSNKYFIYLIISTILLFVLAFISFLIQPRYETFLKTGEIIFNNINDNINEIEEINIDNNKKKILIVKDKDNDNWYMSTKSNYKVRNEVVRKNLIQISELRFFEKKTSEEFLYSRLDLDYPNDEDGDSKLITLKNNNNKPLVQFILGKKKKDGVYLKKINDKQTWLTTGILEMSKFEKDWLETKIMDISYENIKKILINRSDNDGSFSLTKDEKNENLLIDNLNKDQIPKSDLTANFLGYFFTNLVFDDVVKREENIDNNLSIKINFELKN